MSSHSNTAKKTYLSEDIKIPILYIGSPFFPIEALRRKLNDDPRVLFLELDDPNEIIKSVREKGEGVILYHVSTAEDVSQLLSMVQILNAEVVAQKIGFIVITRAYYHHLEETFQKFAFIDVVQTTIEGVDLFKIAKQMTNIMTESVPKRVQTAPKSEDNSKTDRSQNLFTPISDEKVQASLLTESCEMKSIITTSSEDLQDRMNLVFYQFDPQTRYIHFFNPDFQQFSEQISERMGAKKPILLFSFGLRRSRVFFKSNDVRCIDNNSFCVKIPSEIFEVQRRTQLRLVTYPDQRVPLYFQLANQKTKMSSELFDVSASGLAFVAPEENFQKYQKGQILHHLKFEIGERQLFVAEAEVRHVTPIKTTADKIAFYKVGILFKIVLARDTAYLGMYVFKESLDYINRIITS